MRVTPTMRIALSAGVVAIILWRIPMESLWAAVQNLDAMWLVPALACSLTSLAIRAIKWQRLLQAAGSRAARRDVTRSLFGGFALAVVTPGRLGEFARCLFIPAEERGPVISLNVLDRFLDSWSVVTYAVLSLFLAGRRPAGAIALVIWLAFLPVVIALPRLISYLGRSPRWDKILGAQLRNARSALGKINVAPFAGWALFSTSLDVTTFYFLLRTFHPASFMVAPATYPWIVIAAGIPLSVGGFGLREGAAVLVLSHYSFPAPVATDVALFLFAFVSLLPALCGGIWLLLAHTAKPGWRAGLAAPRLTNSLQDRLKMSEE